MNSVNKTCITESEVATLVIQEREVLLTNRECELFFDSSPNNHEVDEKVKEESEEISQTLCSFVSEASRLAKFHEIYAKVLADSKEMTDSTSGLFSEASRLVKYRKFADIIRI